jgi:NitT/TauT family transport system substrate-binding protein
MHIIQNRRHFITGAASAAAVGLIGTPSEGWAGAPLETTSVRLPRWVGGAYCWAGVYMAGELLRADGFSDVRFVQGDSKVDHSEWIARGETDFSVNFPPKQIESIDAGVPIKVLSGLHSGCLELIANESIRSIMDLRGKRVGVDGLHNSRHVWLMLMSGYVGLDPANDIQWVLMGDSRPTELFAAGQIDAFLGTPPQPQELRAKGIGHTILNNALDRPWSQYFCCMISARADYVDRYPVATKRVLRAILKASDLCASDPQWVAQQMVDRDFVPSYDYALQTLQDIRYDRWRDFDAEDALRFYTLRMQEIGMITSSPQEIIANGTDWRFLNELKRELKS